MQRLARERAAGGSQGLTIIVGDRRYDSYRFLRLLRSSGCAQVVRLRRDRVLYQPAHPTLDAVVPARAARASPSKRPRRGVHLMPRWRLTTRTEAGCTCARRWRRSSV